MSKNRPRNPLPEPTANTGPSKMQPAYWQNRLFKNTYTYHGTKRQVLNWCVKFQFRGERKTISLKSAEPRLAAVEACQLYQAINRQGWGAMEKLGPYFVGAESQESFGRDYWAQRLVHRLHTMEQLSKPRAELSIRIEHQGTCHYFPLDTADQDQAAERAAQIYHCVVSRGWEVANRQFRRELTLAFRWLDNPLVWTYTTIHTHATPNALAADAESGVSKREGGLEVVIAEENPGIREALVWCINQSETFHCRIAVACASDLMRVLPLRSPRLILLNHSLADKLDRGQVEMALATGAPVATLRYSVSEDSEELFKTTPGGAPFYLLCRTPATNLLEPIQELLRQRPLSNEELTAAAWQYFKASLANLPRTGLERPFSQLTQREEEVLALLSKGHPDKEIAGRLGISVYTVHEHVRNVFEKLHVHNRIGAVVKYLQK